ncbi:Nn.00g045290.m01.CDS01 [Neocucurbitaria sp. VM-36]
MAPIPLDFASVPNGISKGAEVSIAELGPLSPTLEPFQSLQLPKLGANGELSKLTMTTRPNFGRSTSVAFEGRGTVHDFLKFLQNERFKHMPHDGSSWDRILKWADNIGGVVLLSLGVLSEFMLNSENATRLICDSCTSLIQLGPGHTKTLLKVFSQFHRIAVSLSVFIRQSHLVKSNSDVRRELAHAFQHFAHLTRDARIFCHARSRGVALINSTELDLFMAAGSATFYRHLETVSISSWTSSKHCSHFNVRGIRNFLSPQDSVIKKILSNQLYSESRRAEFTCEWFAGPLRKFVRNGKKVMLISGPACSGKTVLARYIHEKLQTDNVDTEPFDVITYSVDTNVKYTTSSLNMIKALLLQLLDRKFGNHSLLSHINEAMEHAQGGCGSNEVEAALWKAFETCLDDRKLLVLIDGLDHLSGSRIGNPPALEKLNVITRNKRNVKAILLSRPVCDAALKHCQEHIALDTVQEASRDIKHFIEDFIHHRPGLRHLNESEKHEIVQKYAAASHGSFLLAGLQLRYVEDESSAADILKALKSHKTVEEVLDRQIASLDAKRTDMKHILSWISAAERPLALTEIKALLEVDLDGCAYRPFSGDVEQTLRQSCGSLIVVRDGLVSFRHPSIRERLASKSGSRLVIDTKEAHRELTIRSMAYVKIHLQRDDLEPLADFYDGHEIATSFLRYDLFEYAARYWISHFRSSTMYDSGTGKLNLPSQFKSTFSNATRLALFEGSCIARQYIACEAEKLQNLAYHIRKTLFGDHSPAVLQSLILELRIGRKFKNAVALCEFSFEAWSMSRHICSTAVVQSLAESFVEYSLTLKISEHSVLCAHKIEILNYLVEVYKHDHNEEREIHYLRILAELHVETGHVEEAVVIYRQLYRLRLKICGHLHEETHSLFEVLITYLRQLSFHDEALDLYVEYHEHCEQTLVITDERRIRSTLTIVEIYEERKEVFKAEQVLVRFWKHVSVAKTTTRITELKIDFALKYSKFLFRYSRREESEVILRGVYTEIQSYSYEARFSSTMIKRVEKIAKYFSKLEVFSMSRSIYQSLYEHYESHEQRTSTECITIVRTLAETITKSIKHSKTIKRSETNTETSTTTVVSKEEKTLTEIFESCMESTEITSTTISVCQALCSSYMYEERYEEACEIYSRVIKKVWASIETTTVIDITEITESFTEEIFELAFSLAICHFKMLRVEIAETIYFNLFRALICTRYIENKDFLLAKIKVILEFFKTIYKYERVIEIYRELFIWMPICFGKTHSETILVLIEFARICFRMSLYEEAATACFYVYSCFHIAHGCLHIEGFEAAYLLCQIYEIQCKWELAYEVYGYLWRTFVRFGVEYQLDIKIIEKIYHRYMFVLEHHHHAEFSVLLQVSKEYYESCKHFYSHHHEVTIKATLEYAHHCENYEEHRETSIQLYQQVIKYCKETKTEFSKKTLRTCNTRVAKIYASSTKEITKAVEIYKEQYYEMCKTERTSTETITALHSLVSTYKKQETKESISTATSTLKSSVMEIFQHEHRSEQLIESARSIASIYKECKFVEQAETLVTEMRSKVVEEIRTSVSSSTKVEQKSYVFLASFQEAISESSSFTSVMSELREEVLMYESYFKATKKTTDYHSMIKSGYSLYFHLEKKTSRRSEFVKIEKELTEYFCKHLNFSRSVNDGVMHFFFQLYLKQINKTHYEHEFVKQATETVLKFTKTAKFAEAYDLVLLIDRFIHLHGGFRSEFYIRTGFNLARYLVGVGTNKCGDAKLYSAMLDLSRTILQEALEGLDKIEIELCELQQLLSDLVTMLSEQKKYQDLERILQTLWKTRTIRNNMSSSPLVLYIGRSLIQTLACLNKFSDAIHLCYHIRYNLEYIRGALDRSTLAFTLLLSELYTAQHRHRDALDLSENILCRLGEGQSAPGLDPFRIATTHTELLKFAYKRHGKFDKSPQHYYDIFAALDEQFSEEKAWAEKRPQLEKWAPGVKETETFGCWKAPGKFEWLVEGEEESAGERVWREELVKRRASGNLWTRGNGVAESV